MMITRWRDCQKRFKRWRALLSFATGALLIYTTAGDAVRQADHALHPGPGRDPHHRSPRAFQLGDAQRFSKDRDYGPINIDRGLYHIGNRIFFGIYYHDNHHRMVKAFNPMRIGSWLESRRGSECRSRVWPGDFVTLARRSPPLALEKLAPEDFTGARNFPCPVGTRALTRSAPHCLLAGNAAGGT